MLNIPEIIISLTLILILLKLNEKPIYDHLQDLKFKYNKFMEIEEDITKYYTIEE